ncbi:ATP-binding protein [Aquincola tertiaricarbonis]|uniref:ATP-binding protein n=1 Tax=Aquincola tertiaricarbonis TaxID=391953 RepID=UPI000AB6660E|nr:adenylate/guanylate cyclase domain-containing protein [Aquincola tertiaricarbonis]
MNERQNIEAAIKAIANLRGVLDKASIDAAILALEEQLSQHLYSERSIRQVTVLFADVVGSTQMSWSLDPDEIHTVIDGSLKRLTAVIRWHEGVVLQYAGDSLLAVFGVGTAREDDPVRATLCAIALVAEARLIAAQLLLERNIQKFDVRVGIHTGSVMLGGGLDEPSYVRGNAVNIAARLEQSAPAGCVQISYDTHRHVRSHFECIEAPTLHLKGRDRPIKAYIVLKRSAAKRLSAERRWTDHKPRVIGRQTELQVLANAYSTVRGSAATRSVILLGEAGIGKSTLVREFLKSRDTTGSSHLATYMANAKPYGNSAPYGLVRDALLCAASIQTDLDLATTQKALRSSLLEHLNEISDVELTALQSLILPTATPDELGHKFPSDTERSQRRAFRVALDYLLARHPPEHSALILEDIHWADDGSLDFLDFVLRDNAQIFIVATTRPELEKRRSLPFAQKIEVSALDDDDASSLIRAVLNDASSSSESQDLVRLIASTACGNPYFVEEMVGMLADEGVLRRDESGLAVFDATAMLETRIPTTLTGVLQARLASLPYDELQTLQLASIIGSVFWDEALSKLGTYNEASLLNLADKQLIQPLTSSTGEDPRKFQFSHQLMQRTVYGTVPNRVRKLQHGSTARWIIDAFPDRIGDFAETIASHFEKAGETQLAIDYLRRAGRYASAKFSFAAAAALLGRAALLSDDARLRFSILSERLQMRMEGSLRNDDVEAATDLVALADELDDDCRAAAAGLLTTCLAAIGTLEQTANAARDAIRYGKIAGRQASVIRAHNQWGEKLAQRGQLCKARRHLRVAYTHSLRCGNGIGVASALSKLSGICVRKGRYYEALSLLSNAATYCQLQSDQSYTWHLALLSAKIETLLGNHSIAYESLLDLLRKYHSVDWPDMEFETALALAMNRMWAATGNEARAWLEHAATLPFNGPEASLAREQSQLAGEIDLAEGNYEAALIHFHAAARQCDELDLNDAAWESKISEAYVYANLGAPRRAEEVAFAFGELVTSGYDAQKFFLDPANAYLRAAEVLDSVGQKHEATAIRMRALEGYEAVSMSLNASQRSNFRISSPGLRRLHNFN